MTLTRGPLIITEITHGANPPAQHARDMSPWALYDALDTWISGKSRYGRGQAPGAADFKAEADRQIGRIKRELQRRLLPLSRDGYRMTGCFGSGAFGPVVQ